MKKKSAVDPDMEQHTDIHPENEEQQGPGMTEMEENALPDAETAEADPLVKMETELTETRDKYLRLYSEFDNYKKRVARDRAEQFRMATAEAYLSILPMIDDLERALKSINEAKEIEPIREGVQLVYNKIRSISESKGLKQMEAVGTLFDPELHDAVTNMPAPSEDMKGKVLDEIEKGYYLNDKVIRHAKVIVGK